MKIANTPNSHMILLFILLSFSLQAELGPLVTEAALLSAEVYHDTPKTQLKIIAKHEHKLLGNRLVAFRDPATKTLFLTIRGSTNLGNWISNLHIGTSNNLVEAALLKFVPKAGSITKSWFTGAFDDLDQATQDLLSRYSQDRIVFTGHSYGGLMANLLAHKAIERHPRRSIECHTFNSPGSQEIRRKTLKISELSDAKLESQFFNHRRWSDIVGHWNTHEGRVLFYKASGLKDPIEEHQMEQFAKELASGLKPIADDL